MKYLLTTVLLAITFIVNAQVTLTLNLSDGETYTQRITSVSRVNQSVADQMITIDITISGRMAYTVLSTNKEGYEMEVSYEELSMTMKSPQGEAFFSSETTTEPDAMSQMLSNLKKNPFNITLLKNGKIGSITNMDALFAGMFEGLPDTNDAQRAQMESQMRGSFGEDALRGNMEIATAIFPDSQVAVGDVWEVATKLNSAISGEVSNTFTFKEKDPEFNRIVGSGKFSTNPETTTTTNGIPMSYDLSGTVETDVKIDPNTGWIMDGSIMQEMKGSATVQGMSVPMDFMTNIKIDDH